MHGRGSVDGFGVPDVGVVFRGMPGCPDWVGFDQKPPVRPRWRQVAHDQTSCAVPRYLWSQGCREIEWRDLLCGAWHLRDRVDPDPSLNGNLLVWRRGGKEPNLRVLAGLGLEMCLTRGGRR